VRLLVGVKLEIVFIPVSTLLNVSLCPSLLTAPTVLLSFHNVLSTPLSYPILPYLLSIVMSCWSLWRKEAGVLAGLLFILCSKMLLFAYGHICYNSHTPLTYDDPILHRPGLALAWVHCVGMHVW